VLVAAAWDYFDDHDGFLMKLKTLIILCGLFGQLGKMGVSIRERRNRIFWELDCGVGLKGNGLWGWLAMAGRGRVEDILFFLSCH